MLRPSFSFLPLVAAMVSMGAPAALPAAETKAFLKRPQAWFASEEAKTAATNLLSYQSDLGGWPKNTDLTAAPFKGRRDELVGEYRPIFDNGATTSEIRFLARMFQATGDARYQRAIEDAVDYILIAQYPTGGWPQFYPPDAEYHRHITFNDDSMVRILVLLQEITRPGLFEKLDRDRREAAQAAFQRGIECILKCQIKVEGRLTAWCAQHDELDYSPRPARKFELVSLSGAESVGIVRLLMSIPRPAPEIVESIEAAVAWLKAARIDGWRIEELTSNDNQGHNFSATQDPAAKPFWARFYDITTGQPLWSNRDGVRKLGMAEIGWARHGYAWTGDWAQALLNKDYPAWTKRMAKEGTGPAFTPWKPAVRIALAGDSTVTDTAGWGFGFKKAITGQVLCQNFAGGGQSSKSFRDTGMWQKALNSKPDYVLIQFGHNDMPGKGPHRETDPETTYAENLRRFVQEVRAAGAKPVLVTSLVRRIFNRDGSGQLRGELAPYANAMRRVATEEKVPLVDLYTRSVEHVVKLGPKGVAPFEPILPVKPAAPATAPAARSVGSSTPSSGTPVPPATQVPPAAPTTAEVTAPAAGDIDFPTSTPATRRDGTHLNVPGSIEFANLVVDELKKVLPEADKDHWFRH